MQQISPKSWLILLWLVVIAGLEYSTPPEYVFGYLYIGPILLDSSRQRSATFLITAIAAVLTVVNVWLPSRYLVEFSTLASRIIAVLAIIATGVLSYRNRRYQSAIAHQQAQLQSQERLSQLRADFVSTLTHDLKTPLLGAIETLKAVQRQEFGAVTKMQQPIFDMMIRSHRTTLQLVETLLDVYRNDSEGLELHLEPLNLAVLAEESATALRNLAATRQVYLNVNYGASDFRHSLWVRGDALQLQRVFANLLTNGINHSPRGEKVEIVLESSSAYQVVKVMDTGFGMTPDELPQVFERFYQGHGDRQGGSGLGLYLTRQIIEAHGGTIWAENRLPHGAIFGFKLPAIPAVEFSQG
jgi:two-component system NarL family sensor kinase